MASLLGGRTKEDRTIHLPGSQVLNRIMRMLVAANAAGFLYGLTTFGNIHSCSGGTGTAESVCMSSTMSPSPLIFGLMSIVGIILLSRALLHSPDEATAARRIRRAGMIVVAIPIVAGILAHITFYAAPFEEYLQGTAGYSVPTATVDVELTD